MTPKQYIEEEKEKYATADEWADVQGKEHFEKLRNGDIEVIDENFLKELATCDTWDNALEIAVRYII